ncbi:MAG TPA: signal peptidase I [Actinomycetes bacterium]
MTRGARARRWAFRLAFALSVVGLIAAFGTPLWFRLHGQKLFIITSGSMEPNILPGDAVVIQPIGSDELRVGQMVTFRNTVPVKGPTGQVTTYTTHRIVAIKQVNVQDPTTGQFIKDGTGGNVGRWFIQTKGDNNRDPDPNLTPVQEILGQVVQVLPRWGYFFHFAQSRQGLLLLFTPPLLLILGAEVLSWGRAAKRSKQATEAKEALPHRPHKPRLPIPAPRDPVGAPPTATTTPESVRDAVHTSA